MARPSTTIHVSGLAARTDESSLVQAFQPFGQILEVHLPRPNRSQNGSGGTGPHRGFGFVVFASPDDVEGALDNMHLNTIDGHTVGVTVAKPSKGGPGSGSAAGTGERDNRRAIWEDEEWIKQYGGGGDTDDAVGGPAINAQQSGAPLEGEDSSR